MDQIRSREAQPDCRTGVTVIAGSMFFKDTDRVLKTMRRRGTAAAFGDGFNRRYNPIHGADLAARCRASQHSITTLQLVRALAASLRKGSLVASVKYVLLATFVRSPLLIQL